MSLLLQRSASLRAGSFLRPALALSRPAPRLLLFPRSSSIASAHPRLSSLLLPSPFSSSFSTSRPHSSEISPGSTDIASSVVDTASSSFFSMDTVLVAAGKIIEAWVWLYEHTEFIGRISFKIFSAVHEVTGFTWGLVIPITCIILRLSMTLPVALWSRKNSQRLGRLSSLSQSIMRVVGRGSSNNKLKIFPKELDLTKEFPIKTAPRAQIDQFVTAPVPQNIADKSINTFVKENAQANRKLFKVNIVKSFAVGFTQAFILFFGSRGVAHYRSLRADDTSQLAEGTTYVDQGMLWFPNLDAVDPYMVLPVIFSAVTFFNIEGFNRESARVIDYRGGRQSMVSFFLSMLARGGGLFMTCMSFFYPVVCTSFFIHKK